MPGHTYAMYALRAKRARLAGEIEAAERAIAAKRDALATLDAVIQMFSPECNPDMIPPIRPYLRGTFFDYRELSRLTLDTLREAGGPVTTQTMTARIMAGKDLPDDPRLRRSVDHNIRSNLLRMERKGQVRRILNQPETWWELVR